MLQLGFKNQEQPPRIITAWMATVSNSTRDIVTMKGSALETGTKWLVIGQSGHTVPVYFNVAGTASTAYPAINPNAGGLLLWSDQVGTAGSTTGCNLFATSAQNVSVLEIA